MIVLKEKSKKEQADLEKDYYSGVLLSQIFCCALCIILFFVFKASGHWEELKTIYAGLLKDDFITAEVDTVMADLSESLFDREASYAVSGSKVESYITTEASEISTTSENQSVATFATVSEIGYKPDKTKTENTELIRSDSVEFVFPVEGGRYTSYFGERTDPISEGDDYHKGIDIGADEGDKIRAVSDGKVTSVGEDSRSGKYLFISHGNGYVTFYCHCSEILVKEGTVIRKGETVALVGSTGYSTGPHLHFELRVDGESIDPLPVLENAA